tara:strand:+ start:246 stop:833 length:588 start_codon:yes stop_codon:yes gene_type:complete
MAFQLVIIEDIVRVLPHQFGEPLKTVAYQLLKSKYESTLNPDYGFIINIINVSVSNLGKIIPGDGAKYHKATFKAITFYPHIQEVIEGEIVEVTDFGAFIRIGPIDALLHLSQITDDYLTSDVKQGVITAAQSKRTLKVGSQIRVRVSAVSLAHGSAVGKIGVTCRQPMLGALEWIEEDISDKKDSKKNEKTENK